MKLLLIDTCGATGSIAIAESGSSGLPAQVVDTESLPGRTASERLVPAIKGLVERNGASLEELAAIVVVHGPGSFTGVRVGVSAAKGLCEALNVPLIAISRLAVLAELALVSPLIGSAPLFSAPRTETRQADTPAAWHIYALLDAGRGEFYLGEYSEGVCLQEALLTRDEVLSAVSMSRGHSNTEPRRIVVAVCELVVAESLSLLKPQHVPDPAAVDALPLALRRMRQEIFDDVATLDANYVRRTDAEIFAKPKAPALAPEQSVR
jgi:tRNA threonylcarbamoyladenosine biosynthesis protein TsaB